MAEGILTDAVGRILEVLGSRALQEIQLACGFKDDIVKLKHTVQTINGVLRDAEDQFNRKKSDDVVTGLLRRLKDAVYDADDLLDDFCTQLKLKELMGGHKMAKEVRIFFSKSNQIAYSLKMGHKIKTIRERLDAIKSDEQFLRFKPDNGQGMNYYNRLERDTHSYVPKENVVGREKDIETIIKLLLDSGVYAENNLSVISIVGIGGVGKTTLVQSVYNAEEVVNHFQLRMWVCVSDDFTTKIIVEKILKSTDTKDIEKLEMDGLQKELRRQIDGQKYLLVLDDVWNDNLEKWLSLEALLRNGAKGSKIIVTTRSNRVAQIMSKPQLTHDLQGLIEDMSWSLFKKIVFGQGKEPQDSSDLVAIGKDIVRKCVGVPLAIRTIARLLYGKDEKYWLSFRDQELFEIDQSEGDIMPILKLSYDHLSPQLKQCFAYCALFPKDYEFEKENLIQLWMAQGFLGASKKNQCLEDVGNEYFMDLLSGSFFQDLEEERDLDEGRRLVTCKMHDLMHDLAQLVVGSECKMITNDGDNVDERRHHISFDPSLYSLEIPTAMLRANRLRTFLPLHPRVYLSDIHFSKFISSFKCLRTLKLNNIRIKEVPTSIGKLKHLRYLDLSGNGDIEELPDSMSKLINLQTLDLYRCESLQQLPRDMRKMVSLRYLTLKDCNSLTSMPRGLGQLTGLRRLSLFVAGKRDRKNDALRKLNGLNELRGRLTIKVLGDKENVNLAEVNLEKKQYLESLWLVGKSEDGRMTVEGLKPHSNLKELSVYGLGNVMFSGCMSSFTRLSKIIISESSNLRSITPLDQLPSLLSLTLEYLLNLEYVSESDRVGDSSTSTPLPTTFFPSLKKLFILNCNKLKEWWKINDDQATTTTEEEKAEVLLSFPRLSELFIWDCPELTCMPLYPTMEELSLEKTSAKTLQQTMEMKMKSNADVDDAAGPSTSYSAFSAPALSNLKSLVLQCIDDLESLPELLQRVNSLVEMDISHSPKLISQLPQCIKYLSSLEKLTIGGCDQLDLQFDDDDCQWQGLRSLRYLKFEMVKNMECLPKWINHITALQHLHIFGCESLMYLPEGMQMDKLEMEFCHHLTERCGNNEGEEWPKIAHIPNILIQYRWIQLEGQYQAMNHELKVS